MDIRAAEVVLPCPKLDETVAFFTDRLGFRVAAVVPADEPSEVVIEGFGVRLRLQRAGDGAPGVLRLLCPVPPPDGESELVAPNGTRIQLAPWDPPLRLPPLRPSFTMARSADAEWRTGRAGMRYRDLIPDRQGGRFIASEVLVPEGGPVPDYVHFHRVRFQMLYCHRGWFRVVYEDQGPPFVMKTGDCVVQPPEIRHRVLECAPASGVIEIGCPAEHETMADPALALPTPSVKADREFEGQRFVHHDAAAAVWSPRESDGLEARDLGVEAATGGVASASVVRGRAGKDSPVRRHRAELLFIHVLRGAATLRCEGRDPDRVSAGDAFVVPAGRGYALADGTEDLELLEVRVL